MEGIIKIWKKYDTFNFYLNILAVYFIDQVKKWRAYSLLKKEFHHLQNRLSAIIYERTSEYA